ncbi:hypothetical protein [Sphingomonas sp.]|uniref:hypothetical protein n=1 Tax=Sphingomonas sp. TaxID=28214 RepID=UPI003B004CC7
MDATASPRPPSIAAFERLYLGSTALYVIVTLIYWSATREMMAASSQVQSNPQVGGMIGGIMIGSFAVTVLVALLLWWLVARGRSVVGKWLVVGTEAIGAIGGLLALLRLARGTAGDLTQALLGLLVTALAIAAAAMLFRADATAWLTEGVVDEEVQP